jgi:glutamate-ammonia-ligase adenylyltransferase
MLAFLRPFVFRRNLDYTAIESLRQMKSAINHEVRRKGMENDLKLGGGGIREVEFIAQCHQLIHGGRHPALQQRGLLPALAALAQGGCLDPDDAAALAAAYRFLRRSEHVIQAEQDRQTQMLPAKELSRLRLACAMGFADWPAYTAELDRQRAAVTGCIRGLLRTDEKHKEALRESDTLWSSLWRTIDEPGRAEADARGTRFADPAQLAAQLRHLHGLLHREPIPAETVALYDRLLPGLLALIDRQADPDAALRRVLPVLEAVMRRTTWVSFLLEQRDALARMVTLCGASPWIAEQLHRQPMLLAELTDRRVHEAAPDRDALAERLARHMAQVDRGDLERQMDELRHFKNGEQLKVAVLELSNVLPLMKVSDSLSWLAEALLEYALELAADDLIARHGRPEPSAGAAGALDFAVIGYGKLGGLELSYGSDLDLVFLYDCVRGGTTGGPRPIANETFHFRLGQRLLHILSSITGAGIVYTTDTRLRPSGGKGSLVSTVAAFEAYQLGEAWTWEHQAIVRARPVAGDRRLWQRFEDIRRAVLCRPRDEAALRGDITGMRRRMREAHLGQRRNPPAFDLKHAPGAIVDIEFMIQYAILASGERHPAVGRYSDNMRLIDALADCGFLNGEDAGFLQQAYLALRAAAHYEALGGQLDAAAYAELNALRPTVARLWRQLLGESLGEGGAGH